MEGRPCDQTETETDMVQLFLSVIVTFYGPHRNQELGDDELRVRA